MTKILDYKIFGDHSKDGLEEQVREFLEKQNGNGWVPHGGITVHGTRDEINCFCQVMVKIKKSWWQKLLGL